MTKGGYIYTVRNTPHQDMKSKSIEKLLLVLLLSVLVSTWAFVPGRNNRVVSSKLRMAPTQPATPENPPESPPKRETNPLPVPTVGLGKDQVT